MKHRWAHHPLVRRLRNSLVGRILAALFEIRVYDRALMVAGLAFIALVPLLIVVATLLSRSDSMLIGNWLIAKFALTGASAEAVRSLFARPPEASGGLTILSVLTVLVSASSFARSIQRIYELAWELPARGIRRTLAGIEGTFVLVLVLVLLAYLSSLVGDLPGGRVVNVLVQLCVAIPAWLLFTYLLLNHRVAWRLLLPGAAVSAVGQVLTSSAGSVYVPHLIERNTDRYGVIGVAIALISWLVVLSLLIVASAVVGAQLGAALAVRDDRKAAE
jgi:membrane protein